MREGQGEGEGKRKIYLSGQSKKGGWGQGDQARVCLPADLKANGKDKLSIYISSNSEVLIWKLSYLRKGMGKMRESIKEFQAGRV